ncbi:MAG: sensor histidine kinase [Clostridia bacterium]|nr:sensor histidine kinase [Clostridia bacterium]
MTVWERAYYVLRVFGLSFGITFLIALLFFAFQRDKNRGFSWKFPVGLCLYLAVVFFGSMNFLSAVLPLPKRLADLSVLLDQRFPKGVLLFELFAAVGLCRWCFSFSWRELIFFASVSYLMQHIPICLYAAFRTVMPWPSWGLLALFGAVYALYYLLLVPRVAEGDVQASNRTLYISSAFAAVVIFLFEYIVVIDPLMTGNLYAAFTCALMLVFFFGIYRVGRNERERERLEDMLRAEQTHYAAMHETMAMIDQKSHDLKHLVALLRASGDSEEKSELLEHLADEAGYYEIENLTGNQALNVVLSEKALRCRKEGIQYYFILDEGALDFMETPDLCVLFGNALDNALEHLARVEDRARRMIFVRAKEADGFVSLHFENYMEGRLIKDGRNDILTSKEDRRNHGFGLKSIAYIVKKYHGEHSISTDDETFALDILFPRS